MTQACKELRFCKAASCSSQQSPFKLSCGSGITDYLLNSTLSPSLSRPKPEWCRQLTRGMRVCPPTSSTSLISLALTPASFMQSRQGCSVRFSRGSTSDSSLHAVQKCC